MDSVCETTGLLQTDRHLDYTARNHGHVLISIRILYPSPVLFLPHIPTSEGLACRFCVAVSTHNKHPLSNSLSPRYILSTQTPNMVRLREIPRTATFAWSPGATAPWIVTGTKSGAVDIDFSNETCLELWDLTLDGTSQSQDAQPKATITTETG